MTNAQGGFPYFVTIRENATGETKQKRFNIGNDSSAVFMFQDGGYACDCNRALFFDGSEIPCSDYLFDVWVVDAVGVTIYDER